MPTPTQPLGPFRNEPCLDFADPTTRAATQTAIAAVESQLGQHHPCLIDNHPMTGGALITSINPADQRQVIGYHTIAGPTLVEQAIHAAHRALPAWSALPMPDRVALLLRAAEALRQRRYEFNAWLTLEVGKNWAEADAEFAEAVDFLEFYARSALTLAQSTTPIQLPGERNQLVHLPLGVVAVLPPWNFPLAILTGMTAAAIVTGNTVVLKPSPDAPTIAAKLVQLLLDAGLPSGVVNLLQGGAETGAAITSHRDLQAIAFTGSRAVGLGIHAHAAQLQPGQLWIKRTILELGGKDAIVVLADADLDLAATGVAASAFGFSGQKCSACSRVIVERTVHAAFVARLLEKVAALSHGAPRDNGYLCPVINLAAYQRTLLYIEVGKTEGRLIAGGNPLTDPAEALFLAPTIFDAVSPHARIAQEEIFGPVLAILLADDLTHALRIANDTPYGLTGALYSTSPAALDRARRDFHVGNLYLNRKCTGAMVGAHPFGGFRLSGTDSKAGGPDYLHHFTQAKSIAERLSSAHDSPKSSS